MISETHHDVCVKRKNLQNADQFCFPIGRDSEWTKFPCFDYHLLCTASPQQKSFKMFAMCTVIYVLLRNMHVYLVLKRKTPNTLCILYLYYIYFLFMIKSKFALHNFKSQEKSLLYGHSSIFLNKNVFRVSCIKILTCSSVTFI